MNRVTPEAKARKLILLGRASYIDPAAIGNRKVEDLAGQIADAIMALADYAEAGNPHAVDILRAIGVELDPDTQ